MLKRSFLGLMTSAFLFTPAFAQDADIIDTASQADGFSTLLTAIDAAGLTETLKGEGPFTVFAPTNEAFEAMDQDVLADLLKPENSAALAAVLTFHVVPGTVMYDDMNDGDTLTTVADLPLTITGSGDAKQVDEVSIVGSDIPASNGVIHVVDQVIVPK